MELKRRLKPWGGPGLSFGFSHSRDPGHITEVKTDAEAAAVTQTSLHLRKCFTVSDIVEVKREGETHTL